MEIRGNESNFRSTNPGRPEPVQRAAKARQEARAETDKPQQRAAKARQEAKADTEQPQQRAAKARQEAQADVDKPLRRGAPIPGGGNGPEVVTDELSKRQLRQLRLANIAADQRPDRTGTQRPVPGGGVDSIQVSADAERLAKVEDTVRKFEVPSRGARLAELRKSFEDGELNSSELILKAAQQMLDGGDSRVG